MTNRLIVLDNEAVQALLDRGHRKHRRCLTLLRGADAGRSAATIVVPTTVRVEAGWDRRYPGAALANRMRIRDLALDEHGANVAVELRGALSLSVADAHLGATIAAADGPCTVITSDTADVRAMVAVLGRADVVVVRI